MPQNTFCRFVQITGRICYAVLLIGSFIRQKLGLVYCIARYLNSGLLPDVCFCVVFLEVMQLGHYSDW